MGVGEEEPMKGYQGSAELKSRFLAHVERHRAEDAIARGTYGKLCNGKFRGCAVGCSLRSLDEIDGRPRRPLDDLARHRELADRLGIPLVLAHLEDRIFEGLPETEAMVWPTLFARAIPVGADLSMVWPRFAHWMLLDVVRFAKTDRAKETIKAVAALFERQIRGEEVSVSEWRSAAANAAANAAYAAYAARYAATAAYAYAAAYDAAASRQAHFRTMAEALLRFMGEAQ